jgi:hypothetical protein
MAELPPFAKLVPGFDFLQSLMKGAGSALPGIGQWVAPTLNPEELEKRIEELRTVQFWLEQNAKMLGATIQALEVQRMTLSTLKTMNVPLDQIRDTLSIKPLASAPEPASPPPAAAPRPARPRSRAAAPAHPAAAMIDPMQWWGALTKQFTQLAATAVKDSATDAAKNLAGAVVKQGMEAAGDTLRKAATMPVKAAQSAAQAAAAAATASASPRPARAPTPRADTSKASGTRSTSGTRSRRNAAPKG